MDLGPPPRSRSTLLGFLAFSGLDSSKRSGDVPQHLVQPAPSASPFVSKVWIW